jgi:RHS repeat-associated protein
MCKSDENALGQATDRYLGSTTGVIRQKYSYPASANFRLTALQSGVSPTYTNLQNIGYSYDAVGNVASIVDVANSSQRQCYSYDALHRLTRGFTTGATTCNNNPNTVGSGPFDETYTYQDVLGGRGGNLTSKAGVGNYTYGVAQAADCPEGALVKANAVVAAGSNYLFYCYDQNGSLRRRKVGSNITATYGYDAENRLTSVSGAAAASFVYDGDGNRVKTTFGSTTTVYVGNIYERDNGSTVRKYYYAGGVRVAMRTGGQIYYLLGDHLGGTNVTANSSGVQISKLLYRPWGETRFSSGTTPTTWRFTGQREDATIGLYYFNARYLDPQLGRFTQADTIVPEPGDPQALNRYAYVLNNPVKFVDSSGHFAFVPLLIAGGIGFIAAGGIDLAKQLIVDQRSFDELDWAEAGGSAVGGLIAGATLGLAPAGAGVISLALLGGAGGAAGSQAQALTQAGIEEFLGTNPQGSVIQEAMELGLFDPTTIAINGMVGGLMGSLSPYASNALRSALQLPESAGTVRLSGEVSMVRWQPDLGWTIRLEGRTLQMPADVFESVVRGIAIGGYDVFSSLIEEAIEQGLITVLEDIAQP